MRNYKVYYQIRDFPGMGAGAMWYVSQEPGPIDIFLMKNGKIVAEVQNNAFIKSIAQKFLISSADYNKEWFEYKGVELIETQEIPVEPTLLESPQAEPVEVEPQIALEAHSQAANENSKLTENPPDTTPENPSNPPTDPEPNPMKEPTEPLPLTLKNTLGKKVIKFLRSTESILLFSLTALLAQTPHTATVFERIAQSNWEVISAGIHAYVYAVSAEIGILIFVLHARKNISYFFAFIAVVINLLYYWPGMSTGVDWVSAFVISIFLPTIIALYSDQIDREVKH